VMKSRLVDELTDRVLASEELQRVVTHLACKAGEVRTRTVAADATAERAARRLLRRKPIIRMGPPEPPSPAGAAPG
jgi:hypothetical protein